MLSFLTILLSKISASSVSSPVRTIRPLWRLSRSSAKLTQKRNRDAVSDLQNIRKFVYWIVTGVLVLWPTLGIHSSIVMIITLIWNLSSNMLVMYCLIKFTIFWQENLLNIIKQSHFFLWSWGGGAIAEWIRPRLPDAVPGSNLKQTHLGFFSPVFCRIFVIVLINGRKNKKRPGLILM